MKLFAKNRMKCGLLPAFLVWVGLIGAGTTVLGQEVYSTWSDSMNITINASTITTNVVKFPVLVRLNSGNFSGFANTSSGGADIRFAKANGTHLSYQIERWIDNSTAEIWVKLDTVYAGNTTQFFKMFWGKNGAADSSKGTAVFDTANGFVAVYHMSETSDSCKDATINNLKGASNGGLFYQKSGAIGLADSLSGNSQYFNAGNSSKFDMSGNKRFTLSAWTNRNGPAVIGASGRVEGIISKVKWASNNNYREYDLANDSANGFFMSVSSDGTSTNETYCGDNVKLVNGVWNYAAGVMDATNMFLYVNGVLKSSVAKTAVYGSSNADLRIGLNDDDGINRQFWNGKLDEVRIEKVNRSADWISLCYKNQMGNSTLLNYCTYPKISTQPSNKTAVSGQLDTFTIVASATPAPLYQWQYSVDGTTYRDTATFTSATCIMTATTAQNGWKFRCRVYNSCGNSVLSSPATLTVCTPPTITTHPASFSGSVGGVATFSVVLAAGVTSPAYQWQDSSAGKTWTDINGSIASTCTISSIVAADSGRQFRCKITNGCGSIISNPAIFSTCISAVITTPPSAQSVVAGQGASFTIAATGASGYQWQDSAAGKTAWTDIPAATLTTYSINATTSSDNGKQIRCKVLNGCSNYLPSSPVILTVCTPVQITTQPASLPGVTLGQAASFSVVVSGSGIFTYQWQDSTASGAWADIPTATLSAYSIASIVTADNGKFFRCRISNGCGNAAISSPASLALCTPVVITTQPVDETAIAGQPDTFVVAASGSPALSYQWQYSTDGTTFKDTTGFTNATCIMTAAASQNGWKFRCRVQSTSACGTVPVNSNAVSLFVCTPPSIATQPVSLGKLTGDTAVFEVVLKTGATNPSYQWQKSANGTTWINAIGSGVTAPVCSVTVAAGDSGVQYRCVVSNSCGLVNSDPAILSVCLPPKITTQPANLVATDKLAITFTIVATGTTANTYQWQNSADRVTWKNATETSATSSVYTFTAATAMDGISYRCLVSNGCGPVIVSNAAKLSVCVPEKITTQPVSQSKAIGDSAVFTITATGTSLTYQWQKSTDSVSFTNVTTGTGSTDARYSFRVALSDNNAKYRCLVKNGCGQEFSSIVGISACIQPTVTLQPRDTNILVGSFATFTIAGEGSGISYLWQRSVDGLLWSDITKETSLTFTLKAQSADDKAKFRCKIVGSCGETNSEAATLSVCTPVIVSKTTLADTAIRDGDTITFVVSATGTQASFTWQKKALTDIGYATIKDAVDSMFSIVMQQSDSATSFRCVVAGACGDPDTTRGAVVKVYTRLRAAFGMSNSSGIAPLTITLSDSSQGNFTKRIWDFGDNTKPDSTSKNPVHIYTVANTYTVKLTISSPTLLGVSTTQAQVFVCKPGENPIQISGLYLSAQKVQLTIKGFDTIVPPASSVKVDSVGIWYKAGVVPTAIATSAYLKSYLLSTLRATKRGTFTDTITVPALTGGETSYGFMNSIFWSNAKTSSFTSSNGFLVVMKDTLPIKNDLTISGLYAPDDTAQISIQNFKSIDTSRVDTIGIWSSLLGNKIDFTDKKAVQWLSAKKVVAAGTKYVHSIVNSQFNDQTKTLYVAVVCVGKNDIVSAAKTLTMTVGKEHPANPIRLYAKTLSANRIRLTWNNVVNADVERIKILYRANTPLPHATNFSSQGIDSLTPLITDTVIIGDKFEENTRYYFGAQIYKNKLWSLVTDSSSATDSTSEAAPALDSNSCAVSKITYDTATNDIRVCYTVDPTQADTLQVGLLYSTTQTPVTNTSAQQVSSVRGSDACLSLNLGENFSFDTTYRVSLWLRKSGGKWTAPSPKAIDSIHIGHFSSQLVNYFSKANDTVFAFNKQVMLKNQPNDISRISNTILYTELDSVQKQQFTPVSIGFEFKLKDSGLPFYVGVKLDSLPKGNTLSDVRMYRKTATGLWVIDNSELKWDTTFGRYLLVLTNQFDLPFAAFIDNRRPVARVKSDTASVVLVSDQCKDTIVLADNVANVKWQFKTAQGGSAYNGTAADTSQFGELTDTTGTIIVSVPSKAISWDNGIRSILIYTDGVYIDTIDLSRSVSRPRSGILSIEEMKWVPISLPMILDTPDAAHVFSQLGGSGKTWKYDNTKQRIFSWSNIVAKTGSWVEYTDTNRAAFSFERGKCIWIKSRIKTELQFGSGKTALPRGNFTFALPPRSWTDFSLPFKFDVTIGDILAATKLTGANVDSLEIYAWEKDLKGVYRPNPVYMEGIKVSNKATILASTDLTGYTIRNPLGDTIQLCIPPIPQAMSHVRSLLKTTKEDGWAVKLNVYRSDSSMLAPVYCGFAKGTATGTSFYPAAPSFATSQVGVYDVTTKKVFGHAMLHTQENGGYAYMLTFTNESEKEENVFVNVETNDALGSDMSLAVYNAFTQKFENASLGGKGITVASHDREYRWLLVGNKDYLAKAGFIARPAKLMLMGTYPNPFKQFVRIRYSLPYEGVDNVMFSVFSISGKLLWSKDILCQSKYGVNELMWNGRSYNNQSVASGIYIVRMVAKNNKRKFVGVFERKITYMP